jgi:hypothetical protein
LPTTELRRLARFKSSQQKGITKATEFARRIQEYRAMSQHVRTCITKTTTTPYDVAEHLRTSERMAAYLDAWFDEAPDDAGGIARARSVKLHAAAA